VTLVSRTETLRRPSIRLAGFDYAQNSSYFVTICAAGKKATFGRVRNGAVHLSALGRILEQEWHATAQRRPYLKFENWVVMPNHFHALFTLLRDGATGRGAACCAQNSNALPGPASQSVGGIVRAFKAAVTRRARIELALGGAVWQRNYFEHIIRNDREFSRAFVYIHRNPEEWEIDCYNPARRR
jgi:REP element-mobilizing transposase RayT